nr:hypothetical protein [Tanacetum cinerariifolium]
DPDPVPLGPNLLSLLKVTISKPRKTTRSSSSKPVSFNSRSCGGSISEKEARADLGEDIMGNLYVNAGKGNNISQGVNSNVSMNVNDKFGPILVPVSENSLLSSRVSHVVCPRILRRSEVLVDGGSKINATFSFNNVEKWSNFSNVNDASGEIFGHLRRMWRAYHLDEVIMNDCGVYFLKFKSEEGMQYVLENGPWIYDIPLEAWNSDGISRISSMIGNLIIMDMITTKMCERSYGRASFARVLIEVDV